MRTLRKWLVKIVEYCALPFFYLFLWVAHMVISWLEQERPVNVVGHLNKEQRQELFRKASEVEEGGLAGVEVCTRQGDHKCQVNGPCNGYPRE